jgi:major intracellular serine protease
MADYSLPDYSLPDFEVNDVGDIQTLSQIYPQNVRDFNIPKVWAKTRGKGVVVAVLDTGCPKDHPDLVDNLDVNRSRSFVEGEDIYDTFVGHGSHCSGTIGAADNTEGIVGMAPEATIVGVKVLDKNGQGKSYSLIHGLLYCLNELKPDVINMSLGSPHDMPEIHEIIKKLKAANIPVICSAGNNGKEQILYPAKYEETIGVGSYDDLVNKNRSQFSSYGSELDLIAPGKEILSTYLDKKYAVMSGTSMAAPAVTGIIALLIAYFKNQNKTLTVDQIKELLYKNSTDMGAVGYDKEFGWGVINAETLFNVSVNSITVKKPRTVWDKLRAFLKKLW